MTESGPQLQVVADTDDNWVRISVTGEIDLHTAKDFADRVIGHVANVVDGGTLTLDLAGVPYCDSMGISALLRIRQACRQAGCRLILANLSPPVQTVLTISGLNAWLDIPPA
jgi:anti-sigma B factor antagonist